jgi:hypothetical protein
MFDIAKYFVKPDFTEIRAEVKAEATRLFQHAYETGCEDGRSWEGQRILSLLHDSIDDTPTTPGSMKDHWNTTIQAMMKKIKEST